jgi:hypothetical protein
MDWPFEEEPQMPWIPQQEALTAAQPAQPAQQPDLGMANIVNPSPVAKSPPASPEEFEQRKAGWMDLLTKIENDPQARMVMLIAGARLMQGRKPGQTTGGGIADAVMMGAMANQMMDFNRQQQRMAERKLAREEQESTARIEEAQQRTAFAAQEQPMKMQKLEVDAKVSALKLKEAQLQEAVNDATARDDPTGEKRFKDARDRVKAELRRIEEQTRQASAAAAASAAHARLSSAQASEAEMETNWRKTVTDPNASLEAKQAAMEGLTTLQKTRAGGSSAQVLHREALKKDYSILLGKPANSPEVIQAVENRLLTKLRDDLQTEYWKFAKDMREYNYNISKEQIWEEFVDVKKRFGVDVPAILGASLKDARVLDESTIAFNMKLHGKSREEVIAQAKAAGYQVPEK